MFWPVDLAVFYPYRQEVPAVEVVGALLVLLVISTLAVVLRRRMPYLLVGWLWYLGMLIPVIGLVQVGAQSMADRYTYLPIVGIFWMAVWGAADLLAKKQFQPLLKAAAVAILLACFVMTLRQTQFWRDSEILFRRDLAVYPKNNATGHQCLGRALYLKGADEEAIEQYQEVLRLLPAYPEAHLSMANSLTRLGRYAEAEAHYQEGLRIDPTNAEGYKSLGSCLASQMKLDAAKTNFLTALQLKPDYVQAHTRLGTLLMAQGKMDEGLNHLITATRIHPDFDEAQYYLAHAYQERRQFGDASLHYRAAIKANPNYAAAISDFAWMTAIETIPDSHALTEAMSMARKACELTSFTNVDYLVVAAAVYSESNRAQEAISTVEQAIRLAAQSGQDNVLIELQKQLARYQSGQSYSGRNRTSPPKPM
jgi:tetratricopeptide (TPR) repeat protein